MLTRVDEQNERENNLRVSSKHKRKSSVDEQMKEKVTYARQANIRGNQGWMSKMKGKINYARQANTRGDLHLLCNFQI